MTIEREDDDLHETNENVATTNKDNVESIPASVQKRGNLHQIIAVSAVFLLTTGYGLPIGYSAVLLPQLVNVNNTVIPINMQMGSWIASVHSLATPFGSFLSGPMTDYLGRRSTLLLSIIPLLIGWCIIATAQSFPFLIIGRVFCGFASGIIGGPAQVYIAETTGPYLRSLLIGGPFVFYSFGILIVYTLGSALHWRVVAVSATILPLISIVAMYFIPETPVWLLRHKKEEKARKALIFLRADKTIAERELNGMSARLKQENSNSYAHENIFSLLKQAVTYKPLFIVVVISVLQILTGTFIVIFYAVDFIKDLGAEFDTRSIVIGTALVRTLCTVVFCGVLLVVRRRTIVTVSCVGSSVTGLIISSFLYCHKDQPLSEGQIYLICFCLLLYIAFNTPLMIMPGTMIGELLPARIRGRLAGSVFAAMNIALFLLAKCYPHIQAAIKLRGVFLAFSAANIIALVFAYMFLPETKGRTLDQIEDYFKENNWLWQKRDKTYKEVRQAEENGDKA